MIYVPIVSQLNICVYAGTYTQVTKLCAENVKLHNDIMLAT